MKTLVRPWATYSSFSRFPVNAEITPHTFHFRLSLPNSFSLFSLSTPRSSMAGSAQSTAKSVSPGDVQGDDTNVFQLIQSHQEKAAQLPALEEIRTVLDRSVRGVLSTFSKKYDGYPSGSMVDFACDADGTPILAMSSLAVHTQDLTANGKCSLLVARDPDNRTDLVITLHGDAIPVSEKDKEAVRAAYLTRHPNAFWVDFGDFHFFRIEPKVIRFVSGVATALLGSGEFSNEEYKAAKVDPIAQFSKPVASHMNKDHAEDTRLIVQHSTSILVDSAYILDLDSLGFNVKAGYKGQTFKLRIPFPRRAEDRNLWKVAEEGFTFPKDTSTLTASQKKVLDENLPKDSQALFALQQAIADEGCEDPHCGNASCCYAST